MSSSPRWISFPSSPLSTAIGDTSAPLPQMVGIAISRNPGRAACRKSLARSITVPPPATTRVSAAAGSASRESRSGRPSSAATCDRTDGEAYSQAGPRSAARNSVNSQRRLRCSCAFKADPLTLESRDDVADTGHGDSLLRGEVVAKGLLDSGSDRDHTQRVPRLDVFTFQVGGELLIGQQQDVGEQVTKLLAVVHSVLLAPL